MKSDDEGESMTERGADRRRLLDYVERFAGILHESGLQRMSARVFSYILVDDADNYTAAEIAQGLGISLAAVSGAVRELTTAGLLLKGRRDSTRADIYRLNDDDIWGSVMLDRGPMIDRYRDVALDGVATLADGAGRDRLQQTVDFMEFVKVELADVRERWIEYRARLRKERESRDRGPTRGG